MAVIGVSHFCDDVTGETQTKARTSMIREKLDKLAQELPSIRFAVDFEGVITLAEGKGLELIGVTTHQLLGQSIFDLYARYPQIADIARRGLHGETFTQTLETSNYRVMLAVAPLEHFLSADQRIIGATSLVILLPGAPKRNDNLPLVQTLEALPDAIMLTTANLGAGGPEVLFVNQAFERLSGLDATTLTSLPDSPLTDVNVLENALKALETDQGYLEEIVSYDPDGTCLTIEWRVLPIRDANGNITHLLSLQRDISQQSLPEIKMATSSGPEIETVLLRNDPENAFAKLNDEELSSYLAHLTSLRGLVPNSSTMLLPEDDAGLQTLVSKHPSLEINPDDEIKDGLKVGLQGQLEEVGGASTLLQMISMIVQSGALHLEDAQGQQMRLFLHTGRIVHVEHPNLTGNEAVMHTLALEHGRFRFMTGQLAAEHSLSLDPITLALEVAKRHDETEGTNTETHHEEHNGLVVLPNIHVALDFVSGVGGSEHFTANLEHDPRWKDHVTLRGRGMRIVVLHGKLEDLPSNMARLQTTR
jgi:PAS domain S-box-containing protein